ncbi:cytochrome c family protein [Methyloversatilis sp. RAC08]|uniref:cytochrome-c peroxidase n=1 Tax=Methyloversatilis sp. RAC08 TaxID=1842540 RepID=UPI00083D596A|nr:cytochrome c peroxidase [Methyloversatilis sp. RAC08]AOF81607.1 cytochrome c family protein [Methyloversatilis sp. RAC08]
MKQFAVVITAALCVSVFAPAMAADLQAQKDLYRRPQVIPFPADNPYTIEKAALGKMLFFEARLSRDNNLSCVSCHNPSFGWQVPFAKAIGAGGKPLTRKSPTTINHAWGNTFFWDGRAGSLEAQARGPIEAPAEMDLPMSVAVKRLNEIEGYRLAFQKAFPDTGLTEDSVLKALATYERTIVTGDTPFDRWVRGDEKAISASAIRGFALFNGKARCATCHSGWNFSDEKFHDIGLRSADTGRGGVTGNPGDMHATRTPGLREIVARAPYMHDGSLDTLEGVLAHYISGGMARPTRSPLMQPLQLDGEEFADLLSFMRTLSSPGNVVAMPNLPAR